MFKLGAARSEKISGSATIHNQGQQSAARENIADQNLNAAGIQQDFTREHHLRFWISAIFGPIKILQENA
jgi:hypothetical protein